MGLGPIAYRGTHVAGGLSAWRVKCLGWSMLGWWHGVERCFDRLKIFYTQLLNLAHWHILPVLIYSH